MSGKRRVAERGGRADGRRRREKKKKVGQRQRIPEHFQHQHYIQRPPCRPEKEQPFGNVRVCPSICSSLCGTSELKRWKENKKERKKQNVDVLESGSEEIILVSFDLGELLVSGADGGFKKLKKLGHSSVLGDVRVSGPPRDIAACRKEGGFFFFFCV